MASLWRIRVCLYCCLAWLSAGTQGSPRSRGRGDSEQAPGFRAAPGAAGTELSAALPLPGAGAAPALLPTALPLPEAGAAPALLPALPTAVPLPGAGAAPALLPVLPTAVPLPGAGAAPALLPTAVPLPGAGAAPALLPVLPTAVPLPGAGAAPALLPALLTALPGAGAAPALLPALPTPLPGAGAAPALLPTALPLPGAGAAPALLPALLTALAARGPRGEEPRLRPDSRALRYMKRLYRMSATRDGIPKARRGRLYNTVRLFTPCWECEHSHTGPGKGDVHSMDLLFSLDRVTAREHLLKSVLLYSFDTSVPISSSITCICHLSLKEHDFFSQVCPNVSHSLAFSLHFDFRKRKWVEMDVTSFLQPLIAANRRNVHMALNFTCLMGDPQWSTTLENPVNVTLLSPSLLLYLNDTSDQAYHRGSSLGNRRQSPARARPRSSPAMDPTKGGKGQGNSQGKRASRQRRNENPKAAPAASPHTASEDVKQFVFPEHECELHSFRLSFSQLGWDRWIIAPHRYSPQFCRGHCPRALGQRYGSPVHTMVQTLIYERLDPSVPRPSCVPAEYSPLSVLTVEPDGSIAYKEYEDMIATKCTCR